MTSTRSAIGDHAPNLLAVENELREWQRERTLWAARLDQYSAQLEQLREQVETLSRSSSEERRRRPDGSGQPAEPAADAFAIASGEQPESQDPETPQQAEHARGQKARAMLTLSPSLWKSDPLSDGDPDSPPMTVRGQLAENPSWNECDDAQQLGSREDTSREDTASGSLRQLAGVGEEDRDASIDEYVARLLQRVSGPSVHAARSDRVAPPAAGRGGSPTAAPVTVSQVPEPLADLGRPAVAAITESPSGGKESEAVAMAGQLPVPSRERHRFAEDLSAMRELANESAQAALKTFEKRSSFERALVNAAYLLIVFACFGVLWLGKGHMNHSLACLVVGLSGLLAIVAGTQSVRLFLRSQS